MSDYKKYIFYSLKGGEKKLAILILQTAVIDKAETEIP